MTIDSQDIEVATKDDFHSLMAIMKLANDYSEEKSGDRLWTTPHADKFFNKKILNGECYVIRVNQQIASVIAIDESDEWSWGKNGLDGQALYVHKLMKDPNTRVKHSGFRLLNFAAQKALLKNKKYLRCDTKPTMKKLVSFYEKCGFRVTGEFKYPSSGLKGVHLEAEADEVKAITKELL